MFDSAVFLYFGYTDRDNLYVVLAAGCIVVAALLCILSILYLTRERDHHE